MPDEHDWLVLRAHATGQLLYDHPTHDANRSLYGYDRDVQFCQLMYELHGLEERILCCAKAKA